MSETAETAGEGTSARRTGSLEFIALAALLTSLTAASLDALLPALLPIAEDFGLADPSRTQLLVTVFILGMALGEPVFGPVSDAWGRKRTILAGLAVYAAGTILAMQAPSLEIMLAGRLIQGIGVAGPKIATRALVRDKYEGRAMARAMSIIFTILILVPMVAPALGQVLENRAGWQSIYVVYLVMAALGALWLATRQRETLLPERRIPLSVRPLVRNARLIVTNGRVISLIVATGFVFGGQLLYLSTAPAIFEEVYAAGDRFALYFAILAGCVGVANFANSRLVMRFGMEPLARTAFIGILVCSAALIATGILHDGRPPLTHFMTLCGAIFFSIGILFGNLNAMTMESLGRVAGLGASLIASISSFVAFGFASLFGWFYDGTVFALAAGFLALAAGGIVLLAVALSFPKDPL